MNVNSILRGLQSFLESHINYHTQPQQLARITNNSLSYSCFCGHGAGRRFPKITKKTENNGYSSAVGGYLSHSSMYSSNVNRTFCTYPVGYTSSGNIGYRPGSVDPTMQPGMMYCTPVIVTPFYSYTGVYTNCVLLPSPSESPATSVSVEPTVTTDSLTIKKSGAVNVEWIMEKPKKSEEKVQVDDQLVKPAMYQAGTREISTASTSRSVVRTQSESCNCGASVARSVSNMEGVTDHHRSASSFSSSSAANSGRSRTNSTTPIVSTKEIQMITPENNLTEVKSKLIKEASSDKLNSSGEELEDWELSDSEDEVIQTITPNNLTEVKSKLTKEESSDKLISSPDELADWELGMDDLYMVVGRQAVVRTGIDVSTKIVKTLRYGTLVRLSNDENDSCTLGTNGFNGRYNVERRRITFPVNGWISMKISAGPIMKKLSKDELRPCLEMQGTNQSDIHTFAGKAVDIQVKEDEDRTLFYFDKHNDAWEASCRKVKWARGYKQKMQMNSRLFGTDWKSIY